MTLRDLEKMDALEFALWADRHEQVERRTGEERRQAAYGWRALGFAFERRSLFVRRQKEES